jgi:hypothetical protein
MKALGRRGYVVLRVTLDPRVSLPNEVRVGEFGDQGKGGRRRGGGVTEG